MRRSGSGTELSPLSPIRPGSGGGTPTKSNSMTRLPNEQPLVGMELGTGAAEGTGSRPGSKNGSRPSSSSRSGSHGKAAALVRLPDETGSLVQTRRLSGEARPGSSGGVSPTGLNGQTPKASLSRLPDDALGIPPGSVGGAGAGSVSPVGGTGAGSLRDRMKMGLTINTKSEAAGSAKERPKAFRLLKDGETVEKYYDFGDQIHDGGPRGKVLKAFRISDRKEVVVKVRAKKPDKAGERAWREVMAQLHGMRHQSAHVLDIFEILEDSSAFFIVMPMCEGGELFNFLVTEAEVPESECKRIIREILTAVGHLHENNLIHRDVKPENVMFDLDKDCHESPKTVKLIDFDTCMEWTPMTPKGKQFVGTPGYIAPEALLGQASPQSDLWSVGVICYILMTGETPWTTIETLEDGTVGSAGANRMYNSLKSAVIDWESEPWPDFPLARDLCQKLMAFEVDERPWSVSEALAHPWLSA